MDSINWNRNPADDDGRRGACIILCAPRGHVRAAKGLIGRAIRTALKIKKWHTEPHYVSYVSESEIRGYGDGGQDPRFTATVTDDEFDAIMAECERLAKAEGWTRAPVDAYHD